MTQPFHTLSVQEQPSHHRMASIFFQHLKIFLIEVLSPLLSLFLDSLSSVTVKRIFFLISLSASSVFMYIKPTNLGGELVLWFLFLFFEQGLNM